MKDSIEVCAFLHLLIEYLIRTRKVIRGKEPELATGFFRKGKDDLSEVLFQKETRYGIQYSYSNV